MSDKLSGLGFGPSKSVIPSRMQASVPAAVDSHDDFSASESSSSSHGIGAKIGLAALGGLALVGGLGVLGGGTAANASTVTYQCQADPYQVQDEALLGHAGTLFASPASGFNRAAGLYDADGGNFSSANEMTRLDGHQALKQLSCGHPVRLFSQTGWLKFQNLNSFHAYVGTHGTPWDKPAVYLGSQYTANYGSPWYDAQYHQYNDYNSYSSFYSGVRAPSWTYVAPPSYSPPSSWNQAPADPDGNWNQAPSQAPGWNQAPSNPNQAPANPGWNQAPPANSGNWNQAPATHGSSNWNQAPPASSGSNWNQAPASGSSWNQ